MSVMTVVVVEDSPMIYRLITRVVETERDIALRWGGCDATSLMREDLWSDVDVALVDLWLPETVGDELLTWLAEHAPRVRRVALSGSGADRLRDVRDAEERLEKPFHADELLAAIRS